ncbi:MAG: hypothetical protein HUJ95_02785 [Bacteroidales bacterium]|nr:hypothetical protein [Bacteroidales bacterium]
MFKTRMLDKRISIVDRDILVQLPCRGVIDVKSVSINNTEMTNIDIDESTLRIFDAFPVSRKDLVKIDYIAGLEEPFTALIQEIVADRITHGLAQSYGVTSEAAGGVSVTYNSNWTSGGGTGALSEVNMRSLEPYRLAGVF